jgi:hypothetical protein
MAAASASSWENREADWESYLREQAGLDPCNESPDEEDACRHRAPTKNEAGDRLFSYLLDQLESGGRVSAKMICIIGYWAALSGAEGKVGNLSVHPQSSSGNFQKHLDVLMKHNEAKDIIYNLDVPGYCRSELGNSTISLPVAPAHERLLQDIVDDPHLPAKLRSMKTNGELPLTYDNHPVKLRREQARTHLLFVAVHRWCASYKQIECACRNSAKLVHRSQAPSGPAAEGQDVQMWVPILVYTMATDAMAALVF